MDLSLFRSTCMHMIRLSLEYSNLIELNILTNVCITSNIMFTILYYLIAFRYAGILVQFLPDQ